MGARSNKPQACERLIARRSHSEMMNLCVRNILIVCIVSFVLLTSATEDAQSKGEEFEEPTFQAAMALQSKEEGSERTMVLQLAPEAPVGWPKGVAWNPKKVINAMKNAKRPKIVKKVVKKEGKKAKEKAAKAIAKLKKQYKKKMASYKKGTGKYKAAMIKAAKALKNMKKKLKNAKRPKIVKKVVKKVVKKGGKKALAKEKEKAAKLSKRKGARTLAKKEKEKAAKLAL